MNIAVGFACLYFAFFKATHCITGLPERELSNKDQNGGDGGNNLANVQLEQRSAGIQQRNGDDDCRDIGERCFWNSDECPEVMPWTKPSGKPFCKNRRQKCCYPFNAEHMAGCPEGYIWYPSSNQCFKVIQERITWDVANQSCSDLGEGHRLAKPLDPVGLRSYLTVKYGGFPEYKDSPAYLWLDGRGNGDNIVWQRDQTNIGNDSPLWYNGTLTQQPVAPVSTDDCLELLTSDTYWKQSLIQPYFTVACSDWTERYALCELYLD